MSWQYALTITVYREIGVPRQETYKINYCRKWQLQLQSIMQYKRQSSYYMKFITRRKLVSGISQQDSRGRQILWDC